MYGKHFSSLYKGSMVGSGAVVFAVWGYVIGNMTPSKASGMQVELNSKLLAFIIGEDENEIERAIDFLCSPDKKSRSKEEEGRRLVKLGEYDYRVVNGMKYREIRNEEERRIQNREAQARFREKKSFEGLSDAEKEAVMSGYEEGYKKRRKNGKPLKVDLKAAGHVAGATAAVKEGLREATQ